VAELPEHADQMLFQGKPGVIGADRDAHGVKLYL
jgi:hypothetical protein